VRPAVDAHPVWIGEPVAERQPNGNAVPDRQSDGQRHSVGGRNAHRHTDPKPLLISRFLRPEVARRAQRL